MGDMCIHLALSFLPVQKEVLINPSFRHTPIREPLILHLNHPNPTYIPGFHLARGGVLLALPTSYLTGGKEGALVRTFSLSLGLTDVTLEVSGSSRENLSTLKSQCALWMV